MISGSGLLRSNRRRRRLGARLATCSFALALFLVVVPSSIAAPGDLDPSFGSGGRVMLDLGFGDAAATSVLVLPNGQMLVGGTSFNGTDLDFAIVLLNADGTRDPSFGIDGVLRTDFGGSDDSLSGLARQPDGKFVGVGREILGGNTNFAVARYNANGTLDSSFGSGGKVVTDVYPLISGSDPPDVLELARSVLIQPDGNVLVGGFATLPGTNRDFAVLRYDANGNLDPSFGSGGIVTTDLRGTGATDTGSSLLLRSDGKLLLFGSATGGIGTGTDVAFIRYSTTGAVEQKVAVDYGSSNDFAAASVLQPDGKMVIAGARAANSTEFDTLIARFNPDSTLDTSFGSLSRTVSNWGGNDRATGLILLTDGKFAVSGWRTTSNGAFDFNAARYNANGTNDTSFGQGGGVGIDVSGGDDVAWALAAQPDGKLVLAGQNFGAVGVFELVRLLMAPSGGVTSPPPPPPVRLTAAVEPQAGGTVTTEPDGKIKCPTTCTADYAVGTNVGLRATAAPGYRFVRWKDDCSGTVKTCSVVMNTSHKVTAVFEFVARCECVALEATLSGARQAQHSPYRGQALLGFRLNWTVHCSRGRGKSCQGKLKIKLPKGSDFKLRSPASRTVSCSGACNQNHGRATRTKYPGLSVEITSKDDLDPGKRAGKSFVIRVERYCIEGGKKVRVGVSSVTVSFPANGGHARFRYRD